MSSLEGGLDCSRTHERTFIAWKSQTPAEEAKKDEPAVEKKDTPFDKPVPGSTLRRLDDPTFTPDINSPAARPTAATDDLDKAHDRFDRFWGGNKEENV